MHVQVRSDRIIYYCVKCLLVNYFVYYNYNTQLTIYIIEWTVSFWHFTISVFNLNLLAFAVLLSYYNCTCIIMHVYIYTVHGLCITHVFVNNYIIYYIILYCIILYCIILYHIILYYIVLYYIVLYCIILYYIVFILNYCVVVWTLISKQTMTVFPGLQFFITFWVTCCFHSQWNLCW